jgi:hypothetical protein
MFKLLPLAALALLASTPARAERPPVGEPPVEASIATQQIVLGTLTGILAGGGAVAIGAGGGAWGAPFVATAVLPGYSVCVLGQSSAWYDGPCAAPVVGAFVGALGVGVPAGAWAYGHVNDQQMWPLVVAAVAASFGSAVGATVAWHAIKHRRAPGGSQRAASDPPPPASSWPEMPRISLTPAGRTVSLPLLGFAF